MNGRISVIIPTFEHAKTIATSLDTLFAQSLQPDEVIIVDDGSTDDTFEVLKPYMHKIVYLYQPNQGAPVARNVGFEQSTGDFVIFWDADVMAHHRMLELMKKAILDSDSAFAYSQFYWGRTLFSSNVFSLERLKKENFIHTSSLLKRSAFPGFDPNLRRFQDWDLWLTICKNGLRGVFIPQPLYTILNDRHRVSISTWLPSWVYKIPWHMMVWMPTVIRRQLEAKRIVQQKHHLL